MTGRTTKRLVIPVVLPALGPGDRATSCSTRPGRILSRRIATTGASRPQGRA